MLGGGVDLEGESGADFARVEGIGIDRIGVELAGVEGVGVKGGGVGEIGVNGARIHLERRLEHLLALLEEIGGSIIQAFVLLAIEAVHIPHEAEAMKQIIGVKVAAILAVE